MNPRRSNSSLPKPGRSAYGVASAVVLLLIPIVVLLGGDWLQQFLNFGAGVLALVCLTCSCIWGLVAQDRILLNIRQRIVAQAIHRVTAVASIAFLLVHIGVKIALDHADWIAALIPFGWLVTGSGGANPGSATLIGMGSLAAYLMIFVGITGALRNQFAAPAMVAARWRAMHMLAYPALCFALLHGLFAGRPAKTFFMVSYELCLAGIMAALLLRAAPRPFKRRFADRLVTLLGDSDRSRMSDLDASRARMSESGLSGYDSPREREPRGSRGDTSSTQSNPLFPSAAPASDPASGYAAAYRATNAPGQPQSPFAAGQTARMERLDVQSTGAIPRVDGPSSTSGSWPVPTPPPVGEAPPSAYDPLQDTGYNIPVYGNPGAAGTGGRDVYDTGETNARYGTYNSNDTYNSGPANEPAPGASFDSPGSGEPWNTPSGGYR
ncbi:cytochrome b/b6 domain-containing protein [Streptomyces arenae]|uniref:cytochrome b/b6 domain-containing protein n=1 Tax=Streptomyces arenae TaxID=29301 RepID=UPI0026592628|nr:cytochrome b/b6 domain-containing protein [Streptomyces arenae]MCG7207490.1 cytochrome b/b6 domain-containing protein [Streptomyces arenae]